MGKFQDLVSERGYNLTSQRYVYIPTPEEKAQITRQNMGLGGAGNALSGGLLGTGALYGQLKNEKEYERNNYLANLDTDAERWWVMSAEDAIKEMEDLEYDLDFSMSLYSPEDQERMKARYAGLQSLYGDNSKAAREAWKTRSADLDEAVEFQNGLRQNERIQGWQNKYTGMSYYDLNKAIGKVTDPAEKAWLQQYAPTRMTEQDYSIALGDINTELYNLEKLAESLADDPLNQEAGRLQELGLESAADVNNRIEELKRQKWQLEHDREYRSIPQNEDFELMSQFTNSGVGADFRGVNQKQDARDVIAGILGVFPALYNTQYERMTEEEVKTFNYLYQTRGKDAAEEYIDYLKPQLDSRRTDEFTQSLTDFTGRNAGTAFLGNVASVPLNLLSGIGALDVGSQHLMQDITGEYRPINYNNPGMMLSKGTKAIRGTTADMITDATGTIQLDEKKHPVLSTILNGRGLADVYQLGMSAVDSRVAALTGDPVTATILLASSAATSGILDALERGATDEQALQMGMWNGAFEALFEFVEVKNLLKGDPNWVKAMTNQAIKEGVGEGLTSVANNVADGIIMADKSELMQAAAEYEAQGLSEREAYRKAFADMMVDIGWDIIGGAASGGLSAGGYSVIGNEIGYRQTGKTIMDADGTAALRDLAAQVAGADTRAGKISDMVGDNATPRNVGRLYNEVNKTINSRNISEISQALQDAGVSKREANKIAGAYALDFNGIELTDTQRELLDSTMKDAKLAEAISGAVGQEAFARRNLSLDDFRFGLMQNAAQEATRTNPDGAPRDVAKAEGNSQERNIAAQSVSEDGRDHILSDPGKSVEVTGIASVDSGKVSVRLNDGGTAALEDVSFGDDGKAVVFSYFADMGKRSSGVLSGMSVNTMNEMIGLYDPSVNPDAFDFAAGAADAYFYGYEGIPQKKSIKGLTDAQQKIARNLGAMDGMNAARTAQEQIKKKGSETKGDRKGKLHFDRKGRKFTGARESSLKAMEALSEALGVDIYIFESYQENGKRVYKDRNGKVRTAPNGWYDTNTGAIHIDLNSGNFGQGTMMFTVAHELTHFIKQWSPEKFRTMANLLMEQYGKKGESVEDLIYDQIAKAKRNGRTISREVAFEEVVADSMEAMLTSGDPASFMADLQQKDKTLREKVKNWLQTLVKKLQEVVTAYNGYKPDSNEGRMVAQMDDFIGVLQKAYGEALVDASENYRANEGKKNTTLEGGDIRYMVRDGILTEESTEQERYNLLKDENITVSRINEEAIKDVNLEEYNTRKKSSVTPGLVQLAGKLGILNVDLKNSRIEFPFQYSVKNLRKSIHHQLDYGGTYQDYVKAMSCFDQLIENAIPIEVHGDKKVGTSRENKDLKSTYVLVSAYMDGNSIVPVEFEVKVFWSSDPKLYLVVALTKIDSEVLEKAPESIDADTPSLFPESTYSLQSIFRNVNPKDGRFLKYVPDGFLNAEQKRAKYEALALQEKEYKGYDSKTEVTEDQETAVTDLDVTVDSDTESVAPSVLFSERTWTASDYVQEREKAALAISKSIGVTEEKAKQYIDDINSIAKMIADDRTRLDYFSSPNRSSFVGNVEYGGSFDFSTLCKKRRLLTGTFTAIQRALPNTALTANEILEIRNRMKEAGLEVSCGLCYVEGSRANMGQFAKEFLRLYKQYYPDAWQPNMADVNTPDGIEWVRINHPECYEQYEYFWNHYGTLKSGDKNLFASQQKPKLYQLHTEYKGEILQKFDADNVEDKNLNGGIRLQSFSDFEIVHLIDTMQIIMDMSRVGLNGQAYTKVPDFAWALGDTGLKINLSLIAKGVDENGNLIFDDVEGMPIEEAMRLRERYSENVGTILVAFNDQQLMAAMADDRVDFIIPFHRSQWKKSQYEAMGLPAKTKDYTFMQNEKFIKPQYHEYRGRMVRDKATNYMPNEYWDFSKSGKENAEAYLEMCARNNKRPKFYKLLTDNHDGSYSLKADGSTDGYWKLLIDFKMYDNQGKGSPQRAVTPDFNMTEANRMLNEYKGGHSSFPVAQGIVDKFVEEYRDSHEGQLLSDRDPIAADMTPRALLANALESVAQNDIERRNLEEYQGKIGQLNKQEARLAELNAQIKELSFSKGPRDKAKLSALRDEKIKTQNRINVLDKSLLRMEAAKPLQRIVEVERGKVAQRERQKAQKALDAQRSRSEAKYAGVLREQRETRAALTQKQSDYTVMEREFLRLAKEFERANKVSERNINELRDSLKAEAKRHDKDRGTWEREFARLMNEYERADTKVTALEAKIEAQTKTAKARVDSRKRTAVREKIRKVVHDIDTILNRGTKKRNVKEGMRDVAQSLLDSAEVFFTDQYSVDDMLLNGIGVIVPREQQQKINRARAILEALNTPEPDISTLQPGQIQAMQDEERALRKELTQLKRELRDVFEAERFRLEEATAKAALQDLCDKYLELKDAKDSYISAAFNQEVYDYLVELRNSLGAVRAKDMSLEQLESVYDAYKMVLTTIRNANKLFAADVKETRDQLAARTMIEVSMAGRKKKRGKLAKAANSFAWNNLKPVYAFEKLGSETMQMLYGNIRKGQDTWAVDMTEANAFRREAEKKHGFDNWDMDKTYTFSTSSGNTFNLNLQQIMSIYAYSKREQAHDHLLKGGIVFEGTEVTEVDEKGRKRTYINEDATAYGITDEALTEIIGKLTAEQRSYVDEMQTYLSATMGDKGNEVSMKLYGVRLFKEANYFPLRSAEIYHEKTEETNLQRKHGEVRIVNSGFTKSVTPKASNPVVLSEFGNTWASHVNEMSMYHAFVLPLEDFRRVYNYSTPHTEGGDSASVKSSIQNSFGTAATSYINQLQTDLNGGAVSDPREGIAKRLVGLFKKGAVMASASVVLQQPSSIGRAFAMIDPKYFGVLPIARGTVRAVAGAVKLSDRHNRLWAELKKYAPVAMIKEMGYFDTGMGRSAVDFLQAKEYSGLREKATAIIKDSDYRDEVLSRPAAVADEMAWIQIWEAVKNETAAKFPGMDRSSEAFLKAAGQRFSEVIDRTQVYDSVLSRSANMRSKSLFMNIWTSFMAEPTTAANMVEDALRKGAKGQKVLAAKTIGAVFVSIVINAALSSIIYAMRDDDEDETMAEKYISRFVTEMLDGINPITYFPFLKDVWSILQGFDVERADMSMISDLTDILQQMVKLAATDTSTMGEEALAAHRNKVCGAWMSAADAMANLVGIPFKNVRRDINAVINTWKNLTGSDMKMTALSLSDVVGSDVKDSLPVLGWLQDETKAERLLDAILAGDTVYADRIMGSYKNENSVHSAIRTEIKKRYISGDVSYEEAIRMLVEYGGMESEDDAYWKLDEWDHDKTEGQDADYSKYDKFFQAVETGKDLRAVITEYTQKGIDGDTLRTQITKHFKPIYTEMSVSGRAGMKGYLLNAMELCGQDRSKAEISLKKWDFEAAYGYSWDDRGDAYKQGAITADQLIAEMMKITGKAKEEAALEVQVYDWQKEIPNCEITASGIEDYNVGLNGSGISKEVYYDAWTFYRETSGEVDADGKSIPYSKCEKVMPYINSLPLTAAQKTAIARLWWAESAVKKYKLW